VDTAIRAAAAIVFTSVFIMSFFYIIVLSSYLLTQN